MLILSGPFQHSVPAVEMKNQQRLWPSYRPPRGKVGREGEVNNVGINKYSERDGESEVERQHA